MMDVEINLAADLQVGVDKNIERVRNNAFRGVLDRHHAERYSFLAHLLKNFGDGCRRQQRDRRAELFPSGKMRVSTLGSKKGDFKRRFDRSAGRNNFSKNGAQ